MNCVNISNQSELEKLAEKLGKLAQSGDIFCMSGNLGVGKTTFTKAFAKGLGVEDYVTSPTFTIIQEYDGRIPLYHFDVYRIDNVEDMYHVGYEEYFYGQGVCIIEWAPLIQEILPEEILWIEIEASGEETREIYFHSTDEYYKGLIKELLEE